MLRGSQPSSCPTSSSSREPHNMPGGRWPALCPPSAAPPSRRPCAWARNRTRAGLGPGSRTGGSPHSLAAWPGTSQVGRPGRVVAAEGKGHRCLHMGAGLPWLRSHHLLASLSSQPSKGTDAGGRSAAGMLGPWAARRWFPPAKKDKGCRRGGGVSMDKLGKKQGGAGGCFEAGEPRKSSRHPVAAALEKQ